MSREKIETLKQIESLIEALRDPQQKLSPRQLEVFSLMYEGHSPKEIAYTLRLSERTVRTYRAKLKAQFEYGWLKVQQELPSTDRAHLTVKPPINAEYLLYLILKKEEREVMIGDLVECYGQLFRKFGKQRADLWFYRQVAGSLVPLLRRTALRIAALAWLGRILRRLVS